MILIVIYFVSLLISELDVTISALYTLARNVAHQFPLPYLLP